MLAGGSLPRYGRVRLRPLLPAVLALALVAAAPAHAGEPVRTYLSRPDLKPVVVRVLHAEAGLAPGAIFLAPGAAWGRGSSPTRPTGSSRDAFYLNSVDEEPDGDLLVSARHTNTVDE